jgi:SAM-dependent methyltransferase
MNYLKHNKAAWNKQVEENNQWTIPVSSEEINEARKGKWNVILTPWIPVPRNWFGEIKNKNILCLASGGGQQAPILTAAGANVTVFDLSPNQLAHDREVAEREKLDIKTIEGDMADLSVFDNDSFDLIFHPVSNCFVPDVLPVWKECSRVLKKGGVLLAGFANPALYLFDESDPDKEVKLEVVNTIPYSDEESLSNEMKTLYREKGYPLEYGHSLNDLIGGQLKSGFYIDDFYEDRHHDKESPLYKLAPLFISTKAIKK